MNERMFAEANTFGAATVRVEAGQRVVSTGPYAVVRHPMYSGALLLIVGVSLALGSYWRLAALVPCAGVLAWRLLDEEAVPRRDLPGYADYVRRVRWRLIPGLF